MYVTVMMLIDQLSNTGGRHYQQQNTVKWRHGEIDHRLCQTPKRIWEKNKLSAYDTEM